MIREMMRDLVEWFGGLVGLVPRDKVNLIALEVHKVNLEPGETLVVRVNMEQIDFDDVAVLQKAFRQLFKGNKVVILSMDSPLQMTSVRMQ